jgi:hypothetical protein
MQVPAAFRRLVLKALARQARSTTDPVYSGLARVGATLGVVANGRMRNVATTAVTALGTRPSAAAVWRFNWDWWYQRSVDELIACQADRLTPEWAAKHVIAPDRPPPESGILLSMHQFNLTVAAARAVQLVHDLAVVSVIEPVPAGDADLANDGFLLPEADRARAVGDFYSRTFDGRLFAPSVAARQGLDLLRRGGSLIILPEFYGERAGPVLGRSISVAEGPLWLAQTSGRPIVPFLLIPPPAGEDRWRLWWGEPLPISYGAIVSMVESGLRRLPSTWPYWRGWHAAPTWQDVTAANAVDGDGRANAGNRSTRYPLTAA